MTEEMKESAQAETVRAEKVGKKRWPVVVGVIVAVLVVAGIGGFAWHNTPSFCGTVCHSSMSEHVDNYYGADDTNGAGLAHWHGVNAGTTCLDCHKADINTQVAELGSQLSGDTDNLGLADRYYVDNDTCLSCHGDSYEALAEQTADLEPYNPHDSPHGQLNCNECHKGHAQQVDTCGQCHPNGGQTMRGTN